MEKEFRISFKPTIIFGITWNIFKSTFKEKSVVFRVTFVSLEVKYKDINFIEVVNENSAQLYLGKPYFNTFIRKLRWSFFSSDYTNYVLWISSMNLKPILNEFKKHKVKIKF